jgi:transglycosylase-like protein with SLT domain
MKKRLLIVLATAALLGAAALAAFTLPASAEKRTVYVKLLNGRVVPVTVDVPSGTPIDRIHLPGQPVNGGSEEAPSASPPPSETPPSAGGGTKQPPSKGNPKKPPKGHHRAGGGGTPQGGVKAPKRKRKRVGPNAIRQPDGTPTPQNPGFVDALPGPSSTTGVPNFVIRKFRVPIFLLPIYQAAGIQFGVRWEVLAAINEIETDYGRNLNVSSAGALGWMQFIPSTWRMYGVDANKDGKKDPYNPVDAIFAAARYLKAAGAEKDIRRAIFAYNHAGWYVDSVMLRARLIAGVPADLVGSLSGLTEGRFPVYAHARYADDLAEQAATRKVKAGQNAANVVQSRDDRPAINIYAAQGSPAVAVNDGVIKKVGHSRRLGRFISLQDVYGNTYTYGHLGEVSRFYPVPKEEAAVPGSKASAARANGTKKDPTPTGPASRGRQLSTDGESAADAKSKRAGKSQPRQTAPEPSATQPVKQRLFAHPDVSGAREHGGLEQVLDAKTSKKGGFETFQNYFSKPLGLNAKDVRLRRLKKGAQVIGGTVLGRIGAPTGGKAAHLQFEIRPAGKGAPRIDPKPILDGWKLLEATAVYRASGRNVLYGDSSAGGFSVGQILLLPKPLLEKRVLSDPRIDIYPGGRSDIRTHQIDRRVLATLEFLAESGLKPSVSCLKSGHSTFTSSGNVSEHSSGNAVDISRINGIPIIGHQEPGGITEQSVRRLMRLQGTLRPHQVISLLDLGQNTLAMADHNDHIHVGFQPLFGSNSKLGRQALAVLKPGQWSDLISRLRKIDNPVVPTTPSKYALPTRKSDRASSAHRGE